MVSTSNLSRKRRNHSWNKPNTSIFLFFIILQINNKVLDSLEGYGFDYDYNGNYPENYCNLDSITPENDITPNKMS